MRYLYFSIYINFLYYKESNNRCAVGSRSEYVPEEHTWNCSVGTNSVKCQTQYTSCPNGYRLTSDGKCQFDGIKLCAKVVSKNTLAEQCDTLGSDILAYNPVYGSQTCCGDPLGAEPGGLAHWGSKLEWDDTFESLCNLGFGIKLFRFEGSTWQGGLYSLEPYGGESRCGSYVDEILDVCRENIEHFNDDPYDNGYVIPYCDDLRNTQYWEVVGCNTHVVQIG